MGVSQGTSVGPWGASTFPHQVIVKRVIREIPAINTHPWIKKMEPRQFFYLAWFSSKPSIGTLSKSA